MCMCVICIFVITAVDINGAHGADDELSYTDTKNVMKQTPDNTIDEDGPDGVSRQPDNKPKKLKKEAAKKKKPKESKVQKSG